MKKTKLLITVLCIMLSIGAVVITFKLIDQRKAGIEVYRVKYLIEKGTKITSDMIELSTISNDAYADIASFDDVVGKYAATDLFQNQILRKNLVTNNSLIINPYLRDLEDDKTLISIPVDINTAVGGVLQPFTNVNVIGIYEENGKFVYSKRIYENVKIVEIKNDSGIPLSEIDTNDKVGNYETVLPYSVVLEVPLDLDTLKGAFSKFYVTALPYNYKELGDPNLFLYEDLIVKEDSELKEGETIEATVSDRTARNQ